MSTSPIDSLSLVEQYDKMCAGKEQYPSESAASAALAILRKEKLLRRAETMRVYECKFLVDGVPHFHFGH